MRPRRKLLRAGEIACPFSQRADNNIGHEIDPAEHNLS
jgi:hypothetical protein